MLRISALILKICIWKKNSKITPRISIKNLTSIDEVFFILNFRRFVEENRFLFRAVKVRPGIAFNGETRNTTRGKHKKVVRHAVC
jgi:hypothetical protein